MTMAATHQKFDYSAYLDRLVNETKDFIPKCGTRYHEFLTETRCRKRLSQLYVRKLKISALQDFYKSETMPN